MIGKSFDNYPTHLPCSDPAQVVGENVSLNPVLSALLRAVFYARDTASPVWDFAIPIHRLRQLGASETDLRWLVRKGYVEHGREITLESDDQRAFRPTGELNFSRRTCFVLTCSGIEFAYQFPAPLRPATQLIRESAAPTAPLDHAEPTQHPHWDSCSRRLRLSSRLVKRFKWPAVNQEAVLSAFQEEGWPERVDDPLPPHPDQDSKRRLADTIKCLNRNQTNRLIHFRGDGTGEGVLWEPVRVEANQSS